VDMDISMDIHGKSVDMDMDMDGKFHIHGKPGNSTKICTFHTKVIFGVIVINLCKRNVCYKNKFYFTETVI